jgi:hypothetical protein
MKLRTGIAAVMLALATGGCSTAGLDLLDSALSLYSDVAYLNGDCPYNLQKYHDRDDHHHCSVSDESPRHQDGTGHHHEE